MNNIKSIYEKLTTRIKKKSRRGARYVLVALLTFVVFMGLTTWVQAADDTKSETSIVFVSGQLNPLSLEMAKTEIKPGLAKADIDKLNVEHDPEAIKAYIRQKAEEYNMDWKLVYAIGAYESGYYKSSLAERQNNFFGRKATSTTWMSWDTAQEGIDNQFEYLKTRYFDRGMDTPEEMNHVYCEGDTWKYMVRNIMANC